jgi:hypothetical protein
MTDLVHQLARMSKPKYTFVVEHLDPELGPWSALEYRTIAKDSSHSGCHFILSSVPQSLLDTQDVKDLQAVGAEARTDSIETYYAHKKERICLLDPAAKHELEPADADVFDVFLFGGILGTWWPIFFCSIANLFAGDDPPRGTSSRPYNRKHTNSSRSNQ